MKLSKEFLEDLRWKEDNGDLSPPTKSDTDKIRILKNYFDIEYLKLKRDLPSEANTLMHNVITHES